jgi:uncharacterized peroxidase-related enzyme
MIAVVVSAINNCEYCVAHHSAALRRYVDNDRLPDELVKGIGSARLEAEDRAMLEYASKLTRKPGSVSKDDLERLREIGFADDEILHIALITGYFNFVNRVASGLGVAIEAEGGSGYRY